MVQRKQTPNTGNEFCLSPAAWIGGKRLLSKRLAKKIDQIDHVTYAEPFVGMGGVFFKRYSRPKAEVINDRSGEVVNLLRILQRIYPQFMDTIKFQITSRSEFERMLQICYFRGSVNSI